MPLTPSARRVLVSTTLAALLACVVLLTLLGHARLTDWDEGIYAGISRAMLNGGWLTPHWNGKPWLEKPPLELWLTALSFRLFGIGEFSARLVSALAGVALVALLHAWLMLRRGELTAWLNTLILLSTFGFQHVARVGEMDVLLSLGCTVALIGLCELRLSVWRGWLVFWSGFAMALMTKGAASVTLPITLVLWFVLRNRDKAISNEVKLSGEVPASGPRHPQVAGEREKQIPKGMTAKKVRALAGARNARAFAGARNARAFAGALVLFLALVLPWHLAMLHRFGGGFTAQYLGLHVLTRATSQIEGHVTPWSFYLRVLLLSAAPWVLLYPAALWEGLQSGSERLEPQNRRSVDGAAEDWAFTRLPFALFALTVLMLFSLAQTRLPHYIAPAYPALSLLTAAWIANRLAPHLAGAKARSFLLRFAAAALACYALAAAVTAGPRRSLHAARLPNGDTTPDNREQIALLKQVFAHPTPEVEAVQGPLLTLRTGRYNPIPTTVFYSGREVQQVTLVSLPDGATIDKYTDDPELLSQALADHVPHLLLADRGLLGHLPEGFAFEPLAIGARLALGLLRRR